MEAKNLAELYDLPAMDWAPIEAELEAGLEQAPGSGGPDRHTSWLATIDHDGKPHVTGVGSWWRDGAFWFQTGAGTRKARNLARDARCSMSIAADTFDITVEGEAELVTDAATVAAFAAEAAAGGWPARVDDSGTALTADFSAPSAGPPPWHVYRLRPRAASVVSTIEPGGATRWTF